MIGKASGARASLWSCGRPTARVCSVWFADCCKIVRRATRNRMMPPVMARTGKEISKFSNIVRPSKPAIARAPAEKRMALPAGGDAYKGYQYLDGAEHKKKHQEHFSRAKLDVRHTRSVQRLGEGLLGKTACDYHECDGQADRMPSSTPF